MDNKTNINNLCRKLEENVGAFITYIETKYTYNIKFKFPFTTYIINVVKKTNEFDVDLVYEEIMNYLRSNKLV